jgi:2-polyprenyl-3-methyl-5-hydroxy-6-metoxy-1,4-benzoquinol methylase
MADLPAPDDVPARPVYNVPFAWDSSHGHMVELLVEHVEPGLVVDIGCGYAPHAERLQQRGFDYVGVDADPDSVANLRERGFGAELADANDSSALVAALDAVSGDGEVAAVLALDVLEHLVSPHLTLDAVTDWMRSKGVATFGVSLPNVTHDGVVLKLMTGRFDMTPSGLLDHTHLRFFTDASVTAMMTSVGLAESQRHDVISPKTDQDWPEVHPALSDGALLGTFLRRARAMSDQHGETFQFVRLYQLEAHGASEPTLLSARPPAPRHAITVLAAPGCSDENFEALDAAMAAQQADAVEVVRVTADDDGRQIIDDVATSYVVITQGGEAFGEHWAAQLLSVADRYPAAVLRTGPLAPDLVDVAAHDVEWSPAFALFEHYLAEGTPGAALAFPTAFLRELSSLWTNDVATIDTHALLIEATGVCGVVDTGTGGVAPALGWRRPPEVVETALARLAAAPVLMPFGAAAEVATTLDRLRAAEQRLAELDAENDALRSDVAWLNGELARGPVRATRKALSLADRVRKR